MTFRNQPRLQYLHFALDGRWACRWRTCSPDGVGDHGRRADPAVLCYAELWTGVELLPEQDRPAAAETLDRVLRASRVLLVADNVAIARKAARAQAAYRLCCAGGPDPRFCYRCQCHLLCGAVIDHQSAGLFQGLSRVGGPHPAGFSGTVCLYATPPRETSVSLPGFCPACVLPLYVVHCA